MLDKEWTVFTSHNADIHAPSHQRLCLQTTNQLDQQVLTNYKRSNYIMIDLTTGRFSSYMYGDDQYRGRETRRVSKTRANSVSFDFMSMK